MASLYIVIGFDGDGNSATPFAVYVGRKGSEMRAAMEKSDAARFEIFNNIAGLRKSNPRVRKAVEVEAQGDGEQQETPKKPRGRKRKAVEVEAQGDGGDDGQPAE